MIWHRPRQPDILFRIGMMIGASIRTVVAAFTLALATSHLHAAPKKPAPAQSPQLEIVRAKIDQALDHLADSGDLKAANAAMGVLLDQVAAHTPADQGEVFLAAAAAHRLIAQLSTVNPEVRSSVLGPLREQADLAQALAFLVKPAEKPVGAYSMLSRVLTERPQAAGQYPELVAAVCVVHDHPLSRRINENTASGDDPIAVIDYFIANERRMFFGVRDVPAELLVFVVDAAAPVGELAWALDKYQGDRDIGKRFFDIDYDFSHFRQGSPKKVTVAGFSLPNILQHGGVCADQAHFAVTVGKAIGVPTAYTRGRGGEVGHAWVGFLQSDGRDAWWNFDSGRYEAYQGVRGIVVDPQTGQTIDDSDVSLLAGLSLTPREARRQAAGMFDAAARLAELLKKKQPLSAPPLEDGSTKPAIRKADAASILALLEAALRLSPCDARGWDVLRSLAADGMLSLADKKKWAGVLERLCGDAYPISSWRSSNP
jgi:hypothetical protein